MHKFVNRTFTKINNHKNNLSLFSSYYLALTVGTGLIYYMMLQQFLPTVSCIGHI